MARSFKPRSLRPGFSRSGLFKARLKIKKNDLNRRVV